MSALIREALELALDLAMENAANVHEALKGYKPALHAEADANVDLIRRALDKANEVPAALSADAKLQQAMDVIDAARARKHARELAERAGTRRCTDRED